MPDSFAAAAAAAVDSTLVPATPSASAASASAAPTGAIPNTPAARPVSLNAPAIIAAKRDGHSLTAEEIAWIIARYTEGTVAPEQMSALTMAIYLRGMRRAEIAQWTEAMINSGQRMNFSELRRAGRVLPTVDKHSTGGVGDKITLPLAPLVASFGVAVPQLSGRGLGHTGGTLDKLEDIPGWRAELSDAEMYEQLARVGAVICAAGAGLAPADKKLYALRDVTSTVESIPLIASSIMSKKIAEGTSALVLDVKVGRGAFMKSLEDARELAHTMVALGSDAGVATTAVVTDMNTPLGLTAGNACEVRESLEVLSGGGPRDVVDLTVALATEMLAAAGVTGVDPATHLANGKAMDCWRQMISAQGGDNSAPLSRATDRVTIPAPHAGVITDLDAMTVGRAAWIAGAGRRTPGEKVSTAAGVSWTRTVGEYIEAGAPLFEVETDRPETLEQAAAILAEAAEISPAANPTTPTPRVIETIRAEHA